MSRHTSALRIPLEKQRVVKHEERRRAAKRREASLSRKSGRKSAV